MVEYLWFIHRSSTFWERASSLLCVCVHSFQTDTRPHFLIWCIAIFWSKWLDWDVGYSFLTPTYVFSLYIYLKYLFAWVINFPCIWCLTLYPFCTWKFDQASKKSNVKIPTMFIVEGVSSILCMVLNFQLVVAMLTVSPVTKMIDEDHYYLIKSYLLIPIMTPQNKKGNMKRKSFSISSISIACYTPFMA